MFGFGLGELLFLAAIALIAIGPKQLPEVARVLGRMINEFRRATEDITRSVMDARDSADPKKWHHSPPPSSQSQQPDLPQQTISPILSVHPSPHLGNEAASADPDQMAFNLDRKEP